MSFNVGSKDVDAVYVSGQQAIVMAGNGVGAFEEWPVPNQVNMTFNWIYPEEIKWAPLSTYDARTSTSSERNPSVASGGVYKGVINSQATYHNRLVNRQFTGYQMVMEAVVANPLSLITAPSSLILASDATGGQTLSLEYGRDGVRLVSVLGGMILNTYFTTTVTLAVGSVLRVEWLWDWVRVSVNGVVIKTISSDEFRSTYRAEGFRYPGFGTFAGPGSVLSTGASAISISGSTTGGLEVRAEESLKRIAIPVNTLTEVCRTTVNVAGTATVSLLGVAWSAPTSFSDRSFTVRVNGTKIGAISDQNGSSMTVTNVSIPADAIITVDGYSTSSPVQNRTVASGILRIG